MSDDHMAGFLVGFLFAWITMFAAYFFFVL